jgi:enamine deaminase RidA (YjgF/YER057c/UK114 family)
MTAPTNQVQVHDPPTFHKPHPLYSSYTSVPLSSTTTLITISRQVAEDPETGETPSSLPEQIDVCLSRLSTCLQHAGVTNKASITRFMYYIAQRGIDEVDEAEGKKGAALKVVGEKAGAWLEGASTSELFSSGVWDE